VRRFYTASATANRLDFPRSSGAALPGYFFPRCGRRSAECFNSTRRLPFDPPVAAHPPAVLAPLALRSGGPSQTRPSGAHGSGDARRKAAKLTRMCLICIDFDRGALRPQEARRALREMREGLDAKHVKEVETKLDQAEAGKPAATRTGP
jgi:hypothetical protein